MPKLKPTTLFPTAADDAYIQRGIDANSDAYVLSDEEWKQVKPLARVGRPKAEVTKERITIRLSRDVVAQFRALGQGWQTRLDSALRQFIVERPFALMAYDRLLEIPPSISSAS